MNLVHITQAQGRIPVTVFQLRERITIGNFAELENTARDAYKNGMRDLIIDLSQTSTLTSIGIRAIIIVHKLLSADRGMHLRIACPTPEISDMLDISGVTQYILLHDTVEEAVEAF
jgi:anti-anti-sigma factor